MSDSLHARLLDHLERLGEDDGGGFFTTGFCEMRSALRSIIDLHKPEFFGGRIACLACSPGMPPPLLIEYPCPTISSVAAALGVELDA